MKRKATKSLALAISIALVIPLTACGDGNGGEVQVLPQHKSYILSIKDYSMMVATQLLISRIVLF